MNSFENKNFNNNHSENKNEISKFSFFDKFSNLFNMNNKPIENNKECNLNNSSKIETKNNINIKTKERGFKFLNIKLPKKIKVILLILVLCFAMLFLLKNKSTLLNKNENSNFNNISYMSQLGYAEKLENKLTKVLSNIKGAGKVSCMITLESGPEFKIANNVDEKTTTVTNGDKTETNVTIVETPILISSKGDKKPIILMEIMPKLKGVIVVAEGAKDVSVKLKLLQACQALLSVNGNNVQIFSGI